MIPDAAKTPATSSVRIRDGVPVRNTSGATGSESETAAVAPDVAREVRVILVGSAMEIPPMTSPSIAEDCGSVSGT
jgi:hypothetical protein